jgi:hypothetical protein
MRRLAGGKCCLLASLLLWFLLLCVNEARNFTHQCTINVDGKTQVNLRVDTFPYLNNLLAAALDLSQLECRGLC